MLIMKNHLCLLSVLFILLCTIETTAQSNKKFKGKKGTSKREIRKRQQEEIKQDNSNVFNAKQAMGSRQNDNRDDLLWHGETANTIYKGAANISLISPSRYGLKTGLELSSYLPLNYWIPNIYIKKRWHNDNWYVASKHGLFSATPGLNWANNNGYTSIVDNVENIPFVLAMKNELLLSRLIINNDRCGKNKPYIILSAGLGVDVGVPFGNSDLKEIKGHFMANRSPAFTGSGYTAYLKARADWQMTNMLMLGGGLKYFRGNFSGNSALEHNLELQILVLPRLSFSLGYLLSVANYTNTNGIAILPFLDITFYLGRKQARQKGLWGEKMF